MTDQTSGFDWVVTGDGAKRRVLAESPELMVVEFAFEAGAVGALHSHPHVQATYVASGSFEFSIDGTSHHLEVGDSLIVPSGAEHGCVAKLAGKLVDTFTPRRDDFL